MNSSWRRRPAATTSPRGAPDAADERDGELGPHGHRPHRDPTDPAGGALGLPRAPCRWRRRGRTGRRARAGTPRRSGRAGAPPPCPRGDAPPRCDRSPSAARSSRRSRAPRSSPRALSRLLHPRDELADDRGEDHQVHRRRDRDVRTLGVERDGQARPRSASAHAAGHQRGWVSPIQAKMTVTTAAVDIAPSTGPRADVRRSRRRR